MLNSFYNIVSFSIFKSFCGSKFDFVRNADKKCNFVRDFSISKKTLKLSEKETIRQNQIYELNLEISNKKQNSLGNITNNIGIKRMSNNLR